MLSALSILDNSSLDAQSGVLLTRRLHPSEKMVTSLAGFRSYLPYFYSLVGLEHRPVTAKTRVQIPLEVLIENRGVA